MGGVASSIGIGPVRMYIWAAVRNGARYLYVQLYVSWKRRKAVSLGA